VSIQVEREPFRHNCWREGSSLATTKKRHSLERVGRKPAPADQMLGDGKDVADLCRELGVSEQTSPDHENLPT
jgi:hypothetical protein